MVLHPFDAAPAFPRITSRNPSARSRARRRRRSRPSLEDLEGRELLAAGVIQFAQAAYAVADNAGTVKITLTRTGGTDATAVTFATSDGTAVGGTDYTPVTGTINFPAGATTESVTLTVMPEAIANAPGRTVDLTLNNPTAGATLGSPSTAVLTITHAAAPGDLDGSFGPYGNGQTSVEWPPDVPNGGDAPNISAAEPDGSSYFAGSSLNFNTGFDIILTKLNPGGTLDTSFGQGGAATIQVDPPSQTLASPTPSQIFVQPDGKIIVAGNNSVYATGVTSLMMVRFNADGTPDTTFGKGGVVIDTPLSPSAGEASAGVVVLSDGEILQAGNSEAPNGPNDMILRLHSPDGSLDLNFGNAGTVAVPNENAEEVALQDGKILIGSSTGSVVDGTGELLIYRYDADGALDTTFGTGGTASTPAAFGGPLLVLPDGSFLAASVAPGSGLVSKFTANGQLDTTFAAGTGTANVTEGPSSMALQPDGKILVYGGVSDGTGNGNSGYAVTRINPDGTLDATFGTGGSAVVNNPPNYGVTDNNLGMRGTGTAASVAGNQILVTGANGTYLELARFDGGPSVVTPGGATVSGAVFLDLAASGHLAAGDPGIAGRTVYVDLDGSGVFKPADPSATTDAYGGFTITGVAPGSFTLRLVTYPGDVTTGPAGGAYPLTVALGQVVTGQYFGVQQVSTLLPVYPSAAPFGASNPDVLTAEVVGLYRLVLDRAPGAGDVAYYVNRLKAGQGLNQIAYSFYHAPEYFTDVINGEYQAFLGRAASAADVSFYVSAFKAGETAEQLAVSLLSSSEEAALHPDNGGFVQALYQDLLGRSATPGEVSYWSTALGGGTSRASLANAIVHSQEAEVRVVDSVYSAFFARQPAANEVNYYVGELRAGASVVNVAPGFLGSAEYDNRAKLTVV